MRTALAAPPCPTPRWDHPFWGDGAPLISAHPAGRGSVAVRDLMGNAWAGIDSPGVTTGPWGPAMDYGGAGERHENAAVVLPTAGCTVLILVSAPSSATLGVAFGGGSDAERLLALIPYAGTVYWDFGIAFSPNRLTWTPDSGWFGPGLWHAMAFRAGAMGSSIWSDGAKVASSATPISRSNASSAPGLTIGEYVGINGDNAIASLELYPRELSDRAILDWTADPYAHLRPRSNVAVLAGATSGGGVTFHPAWAAANTLIGGW